MGIVPINERKTVYIKIVKAPEGGYKGTTKYGIKTNRQSTVDTSVNGYIFVTEDGTEIKSPTINSFSTSGGENSINVTLDINYKNGATENKCYYSIYDNSKWSNYIEGNIKENVCTFEVSPYKNYRIKAYVVDSRGVSSETFEITGKASNEIPKPVIKILKPDSEEEFTENDPATFNYKGDTWYPYRTKIKIVYPEDMTNLRGTYSRTYIYGSYTNSNSWTASAGDNNIITTTETVTYSARIEDAAGEAVETDPLTIHIMPRDINGLENQSDYTNYCTGQVFPVIATGKKSGTIYGTDIYRYNSDIGTAAMHMGLVNEGETYRGYIKLLEDKYPFFGANTRNEVTSYEVDGDNAYIFVTEDGKPIEPKGEITSEIIDDTGIIFSYDYTECEDKSSYEYDGKTWYPYKIKIIINFIGEGTYQYHYNGGWHNLSSGQNSVTLTITTHDNIVAQIRDTTTARRVIHRKLQRINIMLPPSNTWTVASGKYLVRVNGIVGENEVIRGINHYYPGDSIRKAAVHYGLVNLGDNVEHFVYVHTYPAWGTQDFPSYTRNGVTSSYSSSTISGYFIFVDKYDKELPSYSKENNDVTLSGYKVLPTTLGKPCFINSGSSIVPENEYINNYDDTKSYIELDLTNYELSDTVKLTLNIDLEFTPDTRTNYEHYGTIKIYRVDNSGNSTYNYGYLIKSDGTVENGTKESDNIYSVCVAGGDKYRIEFLYKKNKDETGTMKINSLNVEKSKLDIKITPVDTTIETFTDKDSKVWYPYGTKFKMTKNVDDILFYYIVNRDTYNTFNTTEKEITLYEPSTYKFGYTNETSIIENNQAEITCYIMPYLYGSNYDHFDSYNIGKIYPVKVKRTTSSSIYGTEIYEYNTNINTAATHMGLLDDVEEKYVYIKIVPSPEGGYMGTTKNGITSSTRKNSIQNGFIFVTEDGTEMLEPIINSETASMYDSNKIAVVVDAIEKNGTTIEKYYYSIDNGEYIEETNNTYTFTVENPNSIHSIKVYVRDSNGVLSQTKEILTSATKGAPTITLTDEDGNPVPEDQIVHWNGEDWYPYNTKLTINYAEDMTNFYGYYKYIDERTGSMSNWNNTSNKTYTTYLYYSVTYMAKIHDRQTGEETEEVSLKINIMPSQTSGANYYYSYLGNVYPVQVTGTTSGYAYGTDVYTYDSNINLAATHMGLVDIGETDVVYIKIVQAPEGGYKSSTRNGITTESTTSIRNGFIFIDKDGNEITRPKVNSVTTALGDKSITVTVNASSNNATIEKYYYTIDNIGEYVELTDNHYTFTNIEISGPHKIKVYVKDSNNNLSAIREIEGRRNIPKPIFTFNKDPINYNGEKWYPYNTTLTINYSDDSMSYLTGYYRKVNVHTNSMSPSVTSWYSTSSLNVSETLSESYIYEAYNYERGFGEGEHTREKINIMPNPAGLQSNYYNYGSGNTYPVQVTGTTSGNIYGTTIYRRDSNINTAATHMGLVGVGETKVVYIKIVPCPEGGYVSSTQNEITSTASTSSYVGFTFVQ